MAVKTSENVAQFSGFSPEALVFLRDLNDNNSKSWFDPKKSTYKELIETPANALAESIRVQLDSLDSQVYAAKVFRVHRDVRFSKDKTPYNPYIRMLFSSDRRIGAYFLSVDHKGIILGAGNMQFDKTLMQSYRDRIADASAYKALLSLVKKIDKKQTLRIEEPELKKVPAGYEASSDEQGEFLRRKGLALWLDFELLPELHTSKFTQFCVKTFTTLKPLNDWLEQVQAG